MLDKAENNAKANAPLGGASSGNKGGSSTADTHPARTPTPLSFKLPIPPSMNSIYGINYRTKQVYLTNDARYWKSKAKLIIPNFKCTHNDKLNMTLTFNGEWICKNGSIKKKDVHNLVKVVVDAIAEKCGFDDSQVWSFSCSKVQSTEQTVAVTMGVKNETGITEGASGEKKESVGDCVSKMVK